MKLFKSGLYIIVLASALGVLFVQYLSVHPLQMSFYLAATCFVLVGLIWLIAAGFEKKAILVAIVLAVIFYLAGHLSMTKIILARDDPRPVPELTRKPGDPGLGAYGSNIFHPRGA